MTPERLNSWIYRPVTNSKTLVLVHEPVLGQTTTVASWTRDDVEQLRETNGSQGEEVLTACREHMEASGDRETQKFLLQWFGERGTPLRTTPIKLRPEETANDNGIAPYPTLSGDILQVIVPQLLGHIGQQQRVFNGSIGIVLAAYERALTMQQKSNDFLQGELSTYRQWARDQNESDDLGDDLKEARANALNKIVAALPNLVNAGVSIAASKFGDPALLSREQKKARALAALNALDPDDIAELVSGGGGAANDNGNPPQH